MHIKTAASGVAPDCVVVNVTVRSMKLHGGGFSSGGGKRPRQEEIATENVEAVRAGANTNLARHIRNMSRFGVPVIASVNVFPTDTEAEIEVLLEESTPDNWARGLEIRGHHVRVDESNYGHAHCIEVTEDGLVGAADPRAVIGSALGD